LRALIITSTIKDKRSSQRAITIEADGGRSNAVTTW
jgi:hypothetical protein